MASDPATGSLAGLRRFNLTMAAVHLAQAVAVLALSRDFRLPVMTSYLRFDPATSSLTPAMATLTEIPLAWLIVAFFLLSSLAHLIIATAYRRTYERDLLRGLNVARWVEYALSASVMMVAIAMLVGIYDLGALLMLFSLVALMNLLGLVMEVHNQTTPRTSWLSFSIGSLAGIVPWVVVAISFWASSTYGGGQIPAFVYWIYVSIFLFFSCFALNMWLQYRKIGPWASYLYGERAYIVLSLIAKSALAWQVFAGTLRPV
jgi:hypothetical protein